MILAIDSSGLTASVAITDDINDTAIAEYTVNLKKTHSETLLPMIDEIFELTGIVKNTINAVAVAAGPGSFTGLRIGGAAAKGIASALNVPIVPVPTVDGLAYNLYGYSGLVCPIMDARRNQTYTGIYEYVKNSCDLNTEAPKDCEITGPYRYEMKTVYKQCATDIENLIDVLNEHGRDVIFVGDGIPVFNEIIDSKLKVMHTYAPAGLNRQSAVSIGRLGALYIKSGRIVSAADFAPEYLRQSQAERELNEGLGDKS